jgi:hypothetical protein
MPVRAIVFVVCIRAGKPERSRGLICLPRTIEALKAERDVPEGLKEAGANRAKAPARFLALFRAGVAMSPPPVTDGSGFAGDLQNKSVVAGFFRRHLDGQTLLIPGELERLFDAQELNFRDLSEPQFFTR